MEKVQGLVNTKEKIKVTINGSEIKLTVGTTWLTVNTDLASVTVADRIKQFAESAYAQGFADASNLIMNNINNKNS